MGSIKWQCWSLSIFWVLDLAKWKHWTKSSLGMHILQGSSSKCRALRVIESAWEILGSRRDDNWVQAGNNKCNLIAVDAMSWNSKKWKFPGLIERSKKLWLVLSGQLGMMTSEFLHRRALRQHSDYKKVLETFIVPWCKIKKMAFTQIRNWQYVVTEHFWKARVNLSWIISMGLQSE